MGLEQIVREDKEEDNMDREDSEKEEMNREGSDEEEMDGEDSEEMMERLDAGIRKAQARYREAENGCRETEAKGLHSFRQARLIAPCILMRMRGHKVTFSCQICGEDLTKGAREEHLAGHFWKELSARNLLGNACLLCAKQFQDHSDAVVHVAIVHKKLQEVLPLSVGGPGGRVQGREAEAGSDGQGGEIGQLVHVGEVGGPAQGKEAGEGNTYEKDDMIGQEGLEDIIDDAGQGDCIDQVREDGFLSQNGHGDSECQGKAEEYTNSEEATEVPEEVSQSPVKDKLLIVKSQKNDMKPYQCKQCKKKFGEKSNFNRRKATVHKGEKTLKCSQCDKFGQKPSLQRHLSIFHLNSKPHHCEECGKKFGQNCQLNRHMLAVHQVIKPHQCPECNMKFKLKKNLKQHLSVVHQIAKPVQCPECDKKFTQNVNLNRHMSVVHQEVKPFHCPECDKKFGLEHKLKRHLSYMHGGEKSFPCTEPDCKGEFVEKSNLLDHLRSKHSFPKLECVTKGCSAKFTWRSEYFKHKKIAHNAQQGVVKKRKYVKKRDDGKKSEGFKEKDYVNKKEDIKLVKRSKTHTEKNHGKVIKINYNRNTEKIFETEHGVVKKKKDLRKREDNIQMVKKCKIDTGGKQ